jgi:hypothetical protein
VAKVIKIDWYTCIGVAAAFEATPLADFGIAYATNYNHLIWNVFL